MNRDWFTKITGRNHEQKWGKYHNFHSQNIKILRVYFSQRQWYSLAVHRELISACITLFQKALSLSLFIGTFSVSIPELNFHIAYMEIYYIEFFHVDCTLDNKFYPFWQTRVYNKDIRLDLGFKWDFCILDSGINRMFRLVFSGISVSKWIPYDPSKILPLMKFPFIAEYWDLFKCQNWHQTIYCF